MHSSELNQNKVHTPSCILIRCLTSFENLFTVSEFSYHLYSAKQDTFWKQNHFQSWTQKAFRYNVSMENSPSTALRVSKHFIIHWSLHIDCVKCQIISLESNLLKSVLSDEEKKKKKDFSLTHCDWNKERYLMSQIQIFKLSMNSLRYFKITISVS